MIRVAAILSLLCVFSVGVARAQDDLITLEDTPALYETSAMAAVSGDFSDGGEGCCGCSSCGCDCERWYLFPQDHCCGWRIHGWIDAGFIGNTDDPASNFNGPYNAVDRANEPMMNQLYIIAERDLPECGRGLGARVDVLYGEDYFLAESIGMEKRRDGSARWNKQYYGTAIPQAYLSYGNQELWLQMGHFYSVVGYEGVMAPTNFFYSKAYSYQFAGPFTHWGGQLNWNMNEAWTIQVGLHNGWDALERETNRMGVIAKATYTNPCSGAWTSFAITTGDEANNSAGLPISDEITNRTRYSWIVSLPVTCNTEYVFHHWLGYQADGGPGNSDAEWYGIDQYLYYTINDCWKAGFRFEWFRDEEGTRVGLNRPSNPNVPPFAGNFYSLTFGLNYQPTENLTLRPELRGDWYDGSASPQPFDDGTDDSQFTLGFDAILLF